MAWVTPKTNWAGADGVIATDMNRVEGNIKHIEVDGRLMDNAVDISAIDGAGVTAPLGDILNYIHRALGRAIGGAGNWNTVPPLSITQLAERADTIHLSGGCGVGDSDDSTNAGALGHWKIPADYPDGRAFQRIVVDVPDGKGLYISRARHHLTDSSGAAYDFRLYVEAKIDASTGSYVSAGAVRDDAYTSQLIISNDSGSTKAAIVVVGVANNGPTSDKQISPESGWSVQLIVK